MKKQIIIILILCLSVTGLFAAKKGQRESYRLAGSYERSGQYEKAESLYVDLHNSYPDNYNYFSKYKNILLIQRKYDEIKPLLEARYKKNQHDQYARLELSIVYYALGEKQKAIKQWSYLFSKKYSKLHRSFGNTLYNKVLEYRMGASFYEIVDEIRKITQKANFLVRYNFTTALRYRNWEKAVEEIVHIINNNPADLKYVRSSLFLQDPESLLYKIALQELSKVNEVEAYILMADINIHIKKYDVALLNLSKMNEDQHMQNALIRLANTLIKDDEFDLALAAASRALNYSKDADQEEEIQFLIANSLKGAFEKNKRNPKLISKPFKSKFTNLESQSFNAEDIGLIEAAYTMYDSLNQGGGKFAERSALELIHIDHHVYQDIDRALKRAQGLLPTISLSERVNLLDKIAQLYMAKGDVKKAYDFISEAPETYQLMVHEDDKLLVSKLHTTIIAGNIDSLAQQTQVVLSVLAKEDPLYNDVLNYMAFISVMVKDSSHQESWQAAERALLRQDLAEAASIYLALLQENSEAKFVYVLRYLDCIHAMDDRNAEHKFWEKHRNELGNIEMADYFVLVYAGFLEKEKKNEKAVEIYEDFLLSYQDSMYLEKVRDYLRQTINAGEL